MTQSFYWRLPKVAAELLFAGALDLSVLGEVPPYRCWQQLW
ncbi:MAG TPA: hypothetical protein VJW20_02730 [Candidatus Angelobacter sp.]|nr:hypothetical protein [Candidatus Angelobacter sp.]